MNGLVVTKLGLHLEEIFLEHGRSASHDCQSTDDFSQITRALEVKPTFFFYLSLQYLFRQVLLNDRHRTTSGLLSLLLSQSPAWPTSPQALLFQGPLILSMWVGRVASAFLPCQERLAWGASQTRDIQENLNQ